MFELTRSILSIPFYAFFTVLALWVGLFLFFYKGLKLSSKGWSGLEFIWILIGLFGIMTLVDENKKRFVKSELTYLNHWIESDYNNLLKSLNSDINCVEFNHNINLFTKQEFDSLQNRQKTFCDWSREVYQYVDSCYNTEDKIIGTLPELPLNNKNKIYPYDQIIRWNENINQNLIKKKEAENLVTDEYWTEFQLSFGLLLLYFAFGLRLAITTNKYINEKNKT